MVSQICTLWPLQFHQECFILSLMQPKYPDIPSFADFDDCCFNRIFFYTDATHMFRWLPSNRRRLLATRCRSPSNHRRLPANRHRLPSTSAN